MNGWVKLHRCLLDKAVWQLNDAQRIVFLTILILANHKEKQWIWKGEKFKAEPGQFVTSSKTLVKTAKVGRQSVRTALVNLKKLDFLTYESTKTGILITVTNWGLYQSDNSNQPTNQPTANQPLTTTKKDKNDKKNIYAENVTLTEEEYGKLSEQFGSDGAKGKIENLSLYKGSTGKKYASDYLTILNWARKEEKTKPKKADPMKGYIQC